MAEKDPGKTPQPDDGRGLAYEGILRTEFGRRRSTVVEKAMEQLRRESLHSKKSVIERPYIPFGETLAVLFRRWLPVAATILLIVTSTLLITLWRGSLTEKERIAKTLREAKQYAKSQDLNKLLDRAFEALQAENLENAEKQFQKVLEQEPKSPDANFGLGEVRRQQKRITEAEQLFNKAISFQPDYSAPHTGLGLIFQENGNIDEAERLYRKAVELDSKDFAAHVNLGNILKERPSGLAQADALFRAAINLQPNDAAAHSGLAHVLVRSGNVAEAEILAQRACELEPRSAKMANNLGEILRSQGRLDEAQMQYLRALELDPALASARGNLGILYAERGQFEQAEKRFREMLRSETNRASRLPFLVNLAIVCGKQSKIDEAETLFRQALAIAPTESRITHAFALFLADHKLKLDEALDLARQAIREDPNNPDYLEALGWVLFHRGDVIAAKATLERALTLAGDSASAISIQEHLQKLNEMSVQK